MKNTQKIKINEKLESFTVKWLEKKINFLSINDQFSFEQFINKFALFLFEARVHFHDLEASPFYIKLDNKNEIFYEFPYNHRHTFKNFNLPISSLIYDMIKIKDDALSFQKLDKNKQKNSFCPTI
jgi:hypothetical protein